MSRASEKITGFKCSILVIMLTGDLINKLIRPNGGNCCDIVKIMGTNSPVDFIKKSVENGEIRRMGKPANTETSFRLAVYYNLAVTMSVVIMYM